MPQLTIVQDSLAVQKQNIWDSSVSLEESGESSSLTYDCQFFKISLVSLLQLSFQQCVVTMQSLVDNCRCLPACPFPNLHKKKLILQRLIKKCINFPALLVAQVTPRLKTSDWKLNLERKLNLKRKKQQLISSESCREADCYFPC